LRGGHGKEIFPLSFFQRSVRGSGSKRSEPKGVNPQGGGEEKPILLRRGGEGTAKEGGKERRKGAV